MPHGDSSRVGALDALQRIETVGKFIMLKRVLLGVAIGCVLSAAHAEEPKSGGVVNAVIQPEPPGLMLAMVQNGPTQMVSGNIFEGLLRYSPKLEPLPGLAESWTISPDAKVYTFKLKPGVT